MKRVLFLSFFAICTVQGQHFSEFRETKRVHSQEAESKEFAAHSVQNGDAKAREAQKKAETSYNEPEAKRKNLFQDRPLTAFLKAAKENETEEASALIEESDIATINYQGPEGKTALIWAASNNNYALVCVLLAHGADTNLQDADGFTALMEAIEKDATDVAILLIQQPGLDVNMQDMHGFTALMRAVLKKNEKVIAELIKVDADPFKRNKQNKSMLDMLGEDKVLKVLLEPHIKAWREFSMEVTRAIYEEDFDKLNALLQSKRSIDFKFYEKNGATALMIAAEAGSFDIVEMLLKAGADVNLKDNNDCTALMHATNTNKADIVLLLLVEGSNISLKNKDAKTAYDIALEKDFKSIATIITEYAEHSAKEPEKPKKCKCLIQ